MHNKQSVRLTVSGRRQAGIIVVNLQITLNVCEGLHLLNKNSAWRRYGHRRFYNPKTFSTRFSPVLTDSQLFCYQLLQQGNRRSNPLFHGVCFTFRNLHNSSCFVHILKDRPRSAKDKCFAHMMVRCPENVLNTHLLRKGLIKY